MVTPKQRSDASRKAKIEDLAARLLVAAYNGVHTKDTYTFNFAEQSNHAVSLAKAFYARVDAMEA